MGGSAPSATALWMPGVGPGASTGAPTRPFRFGADGGAAADEALPPGTVVGGRYRIVAELGRGGMGRVYEAVHTSLGTHVAIKVLRPDRQGAEYFGRFRTEAEAATRVGHRAIVRVTDFAGRDEPLAYMAMELLRGESLEQWLSQPRGAGSLREGLGFLAEIARGLHAAHGAGVVHRDLKPANLFLHRAHDGQVQPKILDFGIAKVAASDHTAIATAAGTLLGTPYYLAPERALGRPLDPRADLYSLGIIAYELLTGNVPFVDSSFMGVLAKQVKATPLDPRQAAPERNIPDGVAQLTMQLLAKDPAARPRDAAAVADAIEALLQRDGAAIDAVCTGAREPSSDALATAMIDDIAGRPTAVPGASMSDAATAAIAASPAASMVAAGTVALGSEAMRHDPPPVPAPTTARGVTRALGSGGMRAGAGAPRRGGALRYVAIAAVVAVGAAGVGWTAARMRNSARPEATVAQAPAPARIADASADPIAPTIAPPQP
ncbi:MAG: serine/threonine protein kinase, partial [Nannocystaceae bacterium]|nr:serine/threonine protein kinase [Nannocystaceae bacterium]